MIAWRIMFIFLAIIAVVLEYDDGYILLPIFRVRICRNCGECQAVWGRAANVLFKLVFQRFWDGKVHLVKKDS